MTKNKVKVLITTAIASITTILLLSTSFAWFAKSDKIITNKVETGISGSVLTNYFHCGTGTVEDPFVITRPVHWENLIWLHNNIDDFYNAKGQEFDPDKGKGYFFQIGYDLENNGKMEVYNYTDKGYIDNDNPYSDSTLNLTCFSEEDKELIPLGSPQYPFIGTINGNNFNLSGFTVVGYDRVRGEALEDIGIFGYVGPNADVQNIYFSNYTINVDDSAINDESQYQYHTPHLSEKSFFPHVCVGTLAGHIREAKCFQNVYINKATLENTANEVYHDEYGKLDSYGYYGVVEATKEGSSMGTGHEYHFKLDSSKVYTYMQENYAKINNQPLRPRNTEYDNIIYDSLVPDNNLNNDKTLAKYPVSSGFTYITSGLNSYNLIGDDPDDYSAAPHQAGNRNSYQGYNYSLSTLGYQPFDERTKSYRYEVVAEDGTELSKNIVKSEEPLATALTKPDAINEERFYFDSTTPSWKYYKIHRTEVNDQEFTFNVSVSDTFTFSSTLGRSSVTDGTAYAYLFIDGVLWNGSSENSIQMSSDECYITSSGFFVYTNTYNINFSRTIKKTLACGTHYYAFVTKSSQSSQDNRGIYYSSSGTNTEGYQSLQVTQGSFTIDSTLDAEDRVIDITLGSNNRHTRSDNGGRIDNDGVTATGGTFNPQTDKRAHIEDDTSKSMVTLKGVNLNDPEDLDLHPIDSKNFDINYDDGYEPKYYELLKDQSGNPVRDGENNLIGIDETLVLDNDGKYVSGGYKPKSDEIMYDEDDPTKPVGIVHKIKTHDPMWVATMEVPKQIDVAADPVYIADDEIFKGTDEEPGYNPNNIDIVGGGFQFSEQFVTIDGEDNRALVQPVTNTSYYGPGSGVGTKFYATKYCANSIVLVLSNVGGFNEDDKMGSIVFTYDWTISNITGDWSRYLSNFKSMVFKKGGTGNNGYAYFDNVKMYEDDYSEVQGSTRWEKVGTMTLRRGVIEKAAYCALDKDGKILCGYDINGNQIGAQETIKNSQIASYILVVGVKNSNISSWLPIKINTRIRSIQFDYTAPYGFGGDFGSVEYRDRAETVSDTIFNMYFLTPEETQFRVSVEYVTYEGALKRGKYVVSFEYFSPDKSSLFINLYLYKVNEYDLFINDVQVCEDEYSVEAYEIRSSTAPIT